MSDWGRATFGNPCRDCGFEWSLSQDDAVALMQRFAFSLAETLNGVDTSRRHPDLGWSIKQYVCHVGDNLRISAERLMGAARGGDVVVGQYDQDLLAEARNYAHIPIEGALWSLQRAVEDWIEAIEHAGSAGVVLDHPVRGDQSVLDVCRNNTHDAMHHRWDIARTVNQ